MFDNTPSKKHARFYLPLGGKHWRLTTLKEKRNKLVKQIMKGNGGSRNSVLILPHFMFLRLTPRLNSSWKAVGKLNDFENSPAHI